MIIPVTVMTKLLEKVRIWLMSANVNAGFFSTELKYFGVAVLRFSCSFLRFRSVMTSTTITYAAPKWRMIPAAKTARNDTPTNPKAPIRAEMPV